MRYSAIRLRFSVLIFQKRRGRGRHKHPPLAVHLPEADRPAGWRLSPDQPRRAADAARHLLGAAPCRHLHREGLVAALEGQREGPGPLRVALTRDQLPAVRSGAEGGGKGDLLRLRQRSGNDLPILPTSLRSVHNA